MHDFYGGGGEGVNAGSACACDGISVVGRGAEVLKRFFGDSGGL